MHLTGASIALLAATLTSAQTYVVHNNCPDTIIVAAGGGVFLGNLTKGASLTNTDLGTTNVRISTVANGGVVNGMFVAAVAGFQFESGYWNYYIAKDPNRNNLNTGISIKPSLPEVNGFCQTARCDTGDCTTAFTQLPNFNNTAPPDNAPAPDPPLYQCKADATQISFDITFCPAGGWPPEIGTPVYPNFNANKCIDVRGAVFANGTPVQIYDCNGTPAQRWVLYSNALGGPGTKVRVANTDFCLDAGSNLANGVQMKLWQCLDNLAAQQWTYTRGRQLTIGADAFCLDLPSGNTSNTNVLQTWECSDFNTNQIWSVETRP